MTAGQGILEALYRAAGESVRGSDLARRLAVPAARVAAEVTKLEALGFVIESHPHHGYRLVGAPDRLLADDLLARLASLESKSKKRLIGSEIRVLEETSSTNDEIERMLGADVETESGAAASEGMTVFAEHQTRGRGRHGRRWASPRGKGLWFSVLLRPAWPPSAAPRTTVAASVAVVRALRELSGVDARIKWPNDVMVGGKKLAGILTELRVEGGEIRTAILGIGMDVNCQRKDFPTELADTVTSVRLETGRPQDRAELAARVLAALDEWYAAALTDFGKVTDEWARWSTTLGRQLVVTVGTRRIEGLAHALDGDGALLFRKDNGQIERIWGGDAVVEK